MFRVLGFILGSAISVAGILLVLGVPEFHLSNFEANQERFDAALDKIRDKRPDIEKAVDDLIAGIRQRDDVPVTEQPPLDNELPETEKALPATNEVIAQDHPFDSERPVDLFTEGQDIFNADRHWHEFWNPFRSEIAARGFVSQLEKVTGLDYRIVKVKAGVYQVGFAYANDAERHVKLSQISAATGLDLTQT